MPDENDNKQTTKTNKTDDEVELPMPWKQVQGAIWLIGLAYLFWKGPFFPGILVLVAISGVTQALIQVYVKQQEEKRQQTERRTCLLYTSPSPRDGLLSRMPSSA